MLNLFQLSDLLGIGYLRLHYTYHRICLVYRPCLPLSVGGHEPWNHGLASGAVASQSLYSSGPVGRLSILSRTVDSLRFTQWTWCLSWNTELLSLSNHWKMSGTVLKWCGRFRFFQGILWTCHSLSTRHCLWRPCRVEQIGLTRSVASGWWLATLMMSCSILELRVHNHQNHVTEERPGIVQMWVARPLPG